MNSHIADLSRCFYLSLFFPMVIDVMVSSAEQSPASNRHDLEGFDPLVGDIAYLYKISQIRNIGKPNNLTYWEQ